MADEDREYNEAQPGYGSGDADVNENTPPQEQQRPEHDRTDTGDATADEFTKRSRFEESGPGRGAD